MFTGGKEFIAELWGEGLIKVLIGELWTIVMQKLPNFVDGPWRL